MSITDSTTPTGNGENEGDNTALIIGVSVGLVALILITVVVGIWYYRRRTGHWPKPFRRNGSPPISRNPYGSKSYTARWGNKRARNGTPQIKTHQADFRIPTPPTTDKHVYTITEKISSHLREASEKVTLQQQQQQQQQSNNVKIPASSSAGHSSKSVKRETEEPRNFKNVLRKPIHGRYNDIGVYQDRTLPSTLMMTSESKKQMFLKEENPRKRANSATLRVSSQGKSVMANNKDAPPCSAHMQMYNDFGPNSNIGKYGNKRRNRNTSNLSSYVSSKPSNTSDYVSDLDTAADGRKWKRRHNASYLRSQDQQKRVSDCDSMLQDSSVIGNQDILEIYENEVEQALHNGRSNLTVASAKIVDRKVENRKGKIMSRPNSFFDDRTESQQNTMRSEVFYNYSYEISEEEKEGSVFGEQSSDTESMADSTYLSRKDLRSFRSKRRQYDSDGCSRTLDGSKRGGKNKTRKRIKRTRSDGWDSEPGQDSIRRRQSSNRRRKRNFQSSGNAEVSNSSTKTSPSTISSIPTMKIENYAYSMPSPNKTNPASFESSTLPKAIGGTVLEMPIYSQSTWSGPGTRLKASSSNRPNKKVHANSRSGRRSKSKGKRHTKSSRKLSVGGGGRYFCEYDSLPVDLSKLPKDLIAKIGGQTDQLLEPIEQLNFDQLCRPVPNLGKPEGELSARRLVAEKLCLPPGHRDREILSNTYEYEDTGLVTTDL